MPTGGKDCAKLYSVKPPLVPSLKSNVSSESPVDVKNKQNANAVRNLIVIIPQRVIERRIEFGLCIQSAA
jgi:hypothetical protein